MRKPETDPEQEGVQTRLMTCEARLEHETFARIATQLHKVGAMAAHYTILDLP